MASAALSAQNIRLLAQYGTAYWDDEASVNVIWLGLLAQAFPGSEGFVLQPEGQGEGSRKRNDILIRQIADFSTGQQNAFLVFEGKSSRGDSLDTASRQLLDFVKASPKLSGVRRLWGIVARGTAFRAISYQDNVEVRLKLRKADPTDPDAGKPSQGFPNPDYTLALAFDQPGSVESVQSFLTYAKTHIGWIP